MREHLIPAGWGGGGGGVCTICMNGICLGMLVSVKTGDTIVL